MTTTLTTAPDFLDGILTAAKLQQLSDAINERTPTWTNYSSSLVWAATGTQPAIGNGVITAYYMRHVDHIYFTFRIAMGSTTTYGTGTYTFSLPVTAAARYYAGGAYLRDSSAVANGHAPGVLLLDGVGSPTVATVASSTGSGTGSVAGVTAPFTWANGDSLTASISYEAA